MKKRLVLLTGLLVIFLLILSCARQVSPVTENTSESEAIMPAPKGEPAMEEVKEIISEETPDVEKISPPQWKYGGRAIGGNYADADFVALGEGKYRIYYAIEPEVPGNQLEVYSATSSDGIKWITENGVRRTFTVFPDVVKLPGGKWRMYFQNAGVIKSATSSDGLKWNDEPGTRVDTKNNAGLALENVAGPTTIADGDRYVMVYSGSINKKYEGDVPNNRMAVLLWATSPDGLKFEVQGLVLDSRNEKFLGWMDSPDLIRWDDGSIRLFFWGYFGIYESIFAGNSFTEPKLIYEAEKIDLLAKFPPNPPSDPTFGKIGDKWFMYYGQHTKGIYYATLEN